MRRVVVTGLGLVTPVGVGVEPAWSHLLAAKSGIRRITEFDVSDLPSQIAGIVPRGKGVGELDADAIIPPREQRRYSEFILYALAASAQALRDAGWEPTDAHARERTGVAIGSGIGGLPLIDETGARLRAMGPRRISPFFIPGSIVNEAAGAVAIRYGFGGPNHAVATACATGAHSLGDASRMIALGDAEVMVAGGTEGALSRLTIAGFAIMRALSSGYNEHPEQASRPWDRARDGFVLGEGAAIMVLEEREHALQRGARIYAELLGYGWSGDAFHMTAPAPDGAGAARAMRAALQRAALDPSEIDFISAHATSTPIGDPIEIKSIRGVFGSAAEKLSVFASKSATGHMLGAAGAAAAVFSVLALRDQVAPPTLNLHDPDDGCDLDLTPLQAKPRPIRNVLTNAFAFGGANAALVFGHPR
jgi:3-oxoacyl-[acyl-carrier-protein] synthase II